MVPSARRIRPPHLRVMRPGPKVCCSTLRAPDALRMVTSTTMGSAAVRVKKALSRTRSPLGLKFGWETDRSRVGGVTSGGVVVSVGAAPGPGLAFAPVSGGMAGTSAGTADVGGAAVVAVVVEGAVGPGTGATVVTGGSSPLDGAPDAGPDWASTPDGARSAVTTSTASASRVLTVRAYSREATRTSVGGPRRQ